LLCDRIVAGGADLFPPLYVALYRTAVAGDLRRVRELHGVVIRLVSTLYASGRFGSSFMKSLKAAMHAADLCGDTPAGPYQASSGKISPASPMRTARPSNTSTPSSREQAAEHLVDRDGPAAVRLARLLRLDRRADAKS
jgi:hypothetical protein